jgi:hypothetical protein
MGEHMDVRLLPLVAQSIRGLGDLMAQSYGVAKAYIRHAPKDVLVALIEQAKGYNPPDDSKFASFLEMLSKEIESRGDGDIPLKQYAVDVLCEKNNKVVTRHLVDAVSPLRAGTETMKYLKENPSIGGHLKPPFLFTVYVANTNEDKIVWKIRMASFRTTRTLNTLRRVG